MDKHHFVEIDFDPGIGVDVKFICTAPAGSSCRVGPPCFLDGSCNGEDGYHHEKCEVRDERVDYGSCNVADWINQEASIMGEGTVTLPVSTDWTGDDFNFILPPQDSFRYDEQAAS